MGASSGWNLVARGPPRPRGAANRRPRHLVSVPAGHGALPARDERAEAPASLRVVEQQSDPR
jgi:hypothetical protein